MTKSGKVVAACSQNFPIISLCLCHASFLSKRYRRVKVRLMQENHYRTLGTEFLSEPMSVTMVKTVVIPRAILAGTASLEIQNDNQERTTMRNVGE